MLARLKNPAQAAGAVLELKKVPPSPLEFVALADELRKSKSIPKPTLQWAGHQLARISDPLVRHSIVSLLPKDIEIHNGELMSMIRSKSTEMVLSCPPNSARPLGDFFAGEGVLLPGFSATQWLTAFQAAVSTENYTQARAIWDERRAFLSVPINENVLNQFAELAGRYRDSQVMRSILDGVNFDVPVTSALLAATLNCVDNIADVARLLSVYGDIAETSDFRFIGDKLASNVVEVLQGESIHTVLGNILLLGVYRQYSSQLVFHVFRKFLAPNEDFVANMTTAQILANAAYRLGNSKLLVFEIFSEFSELDLDRKFFETMLMCQLAGSRASTAKFVLGEMVRRKIPVRQHIQLIVGNRLDAANLVELTNSANTKFDAELAAAESPLANQARANAAIYREGKSPEKDPMEVLHEMLEFDKRKFA